MNKLERVKRMERIIQNPAKFAEEFFPKKITKQQKTLLAQMRKYPSTKGRIDELDALAYAYMYAFISKKKEGVKYTFMIVDDVEKD